MQPSPCTRKGSKGMGTPQTGMRRGEEKGNSSNRTEKDPRFRGERRPNGRKNSKERLREEGGGNDWTHQSCGDALGDEEKTESRETGEYGMAEKRRSSCAAGGRYSGFRRKRRLLLGKSFITKVARAFGKYVAYFLVGSREETSRSIKDNRKDTGKERGKQLWMIGPTSTSSR